MNDGWIKIYRQLLQWEWFDKPEMVQIFMYFLLKANQADKVWHGITIRRGQVLTSLATINRDIKMSERTIRTCIKRLKKTNEVSIETTNRYTIITICNYDNYQENTTQSDGQNDKQNDTQATSRRQAADEQATTTKECKNIRKKENKTTTITAIASASPDAQVAAGKGEVNFEALKKFVNETLDEAGATIPRIKDMSDQRRAMVLARIKQHGKEAFATVIEKAARSSFLNGGGNKGFRADFSWIIRPNNFLKILEGNYDDNSISTPSINLHNGTTTTTGQHTNAASVRREQFARHIIAKITSPDTPEPDISGNY